MAGVFKRRGFKAPAALEAKTEEQRKQEADAKAEAETEKSNEGKTAEQIQEEADAKAQADADRKAAGEGKTEEELKQEADAKAEAEAEKGTESEESKETAETVKVKFKDLPEAQRKIAQSIIDERIGAISGKAKAETERLGKRVVELTTELETTRRQGGAQTVIQGVNPLMLVDSVEQLDRHADDLAAHEDLLDLHRDTGFEADEAKGVPAFTAEQVRARLRDVRRERERLLPQARELLTKRLANAAALKASYPELYDPTTEDYRFADQLRKQLPELRRLPDAESFVAKFVIGALALAESGKTPTRKAATQERKTIQQSATTRKAPRAPGDGSASLGSVLDDQRRRAPDSTAAVSTFVKTRSRGDLLKAVGALVMNQ